MPARDRPVVVHPDPPPAPKPSLSIYYGATRRRTELWRRLKSTASQLELDGELPSGGHDLDAILVELSALEGYWGFPGKRLMAELLSLAGAHRYPLLARAAEHVTRLLVSDAYRSHEGRRASVEALLRDEVETSEVVDRRPYFAVLVVDHLSERDEQILRSSMASLRRDHDEFVYQLVVVPSFEDALIAVLLNHNIQSCVIRYGFPLASDNHLELLQGALKGSATSELRGAPDTAVALALGTAIKRLRPTIDLFLVTDAPISEVAGRLGRQFRRVFYREEDHLELHLSILKGIRERYNTPFFSALRNYSQKPTGVFHALPISRSKSITKSHWIGDMAEFYGHNVFLAETSATTGGLDSLLQPHGPLRDAQKLAARAFGARRTYFVTNGTSCANKIVLQALLQPGDIVLASRDCHKSHHYAMMLVGAEPAYMDPYPLTPYSMYGAVPLEEIKRHLLAFAAAGKLDRVRVLLLTNCTFDGLVYNVERVMEEVLAIHPGIVFVWDEAWYAFACFSPITRRRTAMVAAARLRERFGDTRPVRVYATQSTHKTLTSMRQGSMIHVSDPLFEQRVRAFFDEAYMTYTSTSPNYQILASMDVGRRQVELEGYELVQQAIEHAVILRERINSHPLLARYFRVLGPEDLIPAELRASGFSSYQDVNTDWSAMDRAWETDELCLDPTRLTLYIGHSGIDGEDFRRRLIEEHDIQINKTSRNTVLFLTHIGTTRGAVAYLVEVLTRIACELDDEHADESRADRRAHEVEVAELTVSLPPLPDFSRFHDAFRRRAGAAPAATDTIEGDLRGAFFAAGDESKCDYIALDAALPLLQAGAELVSAAFVIPYPPGFPVLVPGQVISAAIVAFLLALDATEIHGYEPEWGLRIFAENALNPPPRR